MQGGLNRREFLTLSGIVAISSELKSKPSSLQIRWLELAQKLKESCQGWLTPKINTISYCLDFTDPSPVKGEVRVFYRAPENLRLEVLSGQEEKRHYVLIFHKGRVRMQEEGKGFSEEKIPEEKIPFEPLTFLRAIEVKVGLDEVLEAPEKLKAEAIVDEEDCIQITLTKPEGFRCYMGLGFQHSIRSFATPLKGNRLTLWLYKNTLQPITEVLWDERGSPPTLKMLSVVSYKDFHDGSVPHLVEMTAIVDGWVWQYRMEFEWVGRKVWLLKKGEAWGEFLEPKLMRTKVEVREVAIDKPIPDYLFEPRK